MRVIVDGNSLQARAHARDGLRLKGFLSLIEALPGGQVVFHTDGPLTAGALAGGDVLVITTRKGEAGAYSQDELAAIPEFVRGGGGLLLMSNHGDWPGHNPNDFTKNDALLARRFGVEIEAAFFAAPNPRVLTELAGPALISDHPILRGGEAEAPVRCLVATNCCSLLSPGAAPLVRLTDGMKDHRNGYPARGRCFALAREEGLPGRGGRVVVTADSGFIGTEGTRFPGPGMLDRGDNRRFVRNAVRWLGRAL